MKFDFMLRIVFLSFCPESTNIFKNNTEMAQCVKHKLRLKKHVWVGVYVCVRVCLVLYMHAGRVCVCVDNLCVGKGSQWSREIAYRGRGLRPGHLSIMGSVWPEEFINSYPRLHLTHNLINSRAINAVERKHLAHVCSAVGFVGERGTSFTRTGE